VPLSLVEEYRRSEPPLEAAGAWMDYPDEVLEYGNADEPIVHDAAVMADIIDGVLEYESYHVDVDTSQGRSRRALVPDRYGVRDEEPNAEVSVSIDTEGFRKTVRDAVGSL
jgi:inosine-uridine nucleoside N-ribohydrolase